MNKKPILEVKDLHLFFRTDYRRIHTLRGIDLTLYENEKIAIVGESGSGKTVLAKTLLGLLPPPAAELERGEILYQGQDLAKLSEKEMQKVRGKEIGMVLQDPLTGLNPTLKIGAQISEGVRKHYPLLSRKELHQKVIQLLHLVGIPDPERRVTEYPHTQSGGIRQRILIATALAAHPKILIADEPTTALDVTVQAQILDLMRLIQHNKSIILITHDLSIAASFCDRIVVMYAGKIIEDAPILELFASPKHPYTQKLLQSIPRLDLPKKNPLQPISGSPPDLALPIEGCSFCPRCPQAMKICREQTPPLFSLKEDHKAACFLYHPDKK